MREQARAGRTALSLVVEYCVGGPGDGTVEVRVGKNDGRRFAAEFERDALEVAGGRLDDQLANLCRAGERHLVNVRVLGQGGARGLAETGDDVDHAVWNSGFRDQL